MSDAGQDPTAPQDGQDTEAVAESSGIGRRGLLGILGGGAAGLALGAGGGFAYGTRRERTAAANAPRPEDLIHPFAGEHQAGITTPVQEHLHFAAFDMTDDADRDELIEVLERWTEAARRLTLGGDVSAEGSFGGGELFPPDDSGEAVDLGPSGLTLTVGFGRSLFVDADGRDRFGLKKSMPKHFTELPVMANDFLIPERSDGDLCVQACADDPQVAVHAVRNLTRLAMGKATLRWSQLGFGRASSTSHEQTTPRNLFGQKDGTANIMADDAEALAEHVWIGTDQGPDWAVGGSYLVARRIAMTIEVWDTLQLGEQERVTGRAKHDGSPLSGGGEFDAPDFSAVDDRGRPVIDERSHVHRAHPDHNDGIRMLRRGYNFVDGNDETGRLNAGQFFIAFVNDPARFARVHTSLARDDMFIEYLKTTASGVYLIPPGVGDEGYIGESLLG